MIIATYEIGLIKEIQEWSTVYFIKLFKGSPLFVSKKDIAAIKNTKKITALLFEEAYCILEKRQTNKYLSQ